MQLNRAELEKVMIAWESHWNDHDIEGVMALFHEDIFFEHWHGARVQGKTALRQAWSSWFADPGGFRFTTEELIIDEAAQKVLYRWLLEWPSIEKGYKGLPEKRRGVDVLHFQDCKIIRKLTYTKTNLEISGQTVRLQAPPL